VEFSHLSNLRNSRWRPRNPKISPESTLGHISVGMHDSNTNELFFSMFKNTGNSIVVVFYLKLIQNSKYYENRSQIYTQIEPKFTNIQNIFVAFVLLSLLAFGLDTYYFIPTIIYYIEKNLFWALWEL